jgi:hypothetical protein
MPTLADNRQPQTKSTAGECEHGTEDDAPYPTANNTGVSPSPRPTFTFRSASRAASQ